MQCILIQFIFPECSFKYLHLLQLVVSVIQLQKGFILIQDLKTVYQQSVEPIDRKSVV